MARLLFRKRALSRPREALRHESLHDTRERKKLIDVPVTGSPSTGYQAGRSAQYFGGSGRDQWQPVPGRHDSEQTNSAAMHRQDALKQK
jgi:hypothetical protein